MVGNETSNDGNPQPMRNINLLSITLIGKKIFHLKKKYKCVSWHAEIDKEKGERENYRQPTQREIGVCLYIVWQFYLLVTARKDEN